MVASNVKRDLIVLRFISLPVADDAETMDRIRTRRAAHELNCVMLTRLLSSV